MGCQLHQLGMMFCMTACMLSFAGYAKVHGTLPRTNMSLSCMLQTFYGLCFIRTMPFRIDYGFRVLGM